MSLWVLRNGLSYTAPVKDPWFSARNPHALGTSQAWRTDMSASVIGCTEQYQFCNKTSCTNLNTWSNIGQFSISALNYNRMQNATFELLWRSLWIIQMDSINTILGDTILAAKAKMFGEFMLSAPLPENQWEQELQNFHNISMTLLESILVDHADLPDLQVSPDTTLRQAMIRENSSEALHLCQSETSSTTVLLV